ncbi:MAG: ABC transporter permease [Oscillospiraceae bacterium]|nr:ABC transporter permease [Oscillospiraceae bacterium]
MFLFIIALLLIWQGAYFLGVDVFGAWKAYAVPSPWGVILSLIEVSSGSLLAIAIVKSLQRLLIGYAISTILGLFFGLMMSRIAFLRQNLKPLVLGLQTLPSICWVPFAILWYGLSDSAIIFVIVIGSMFSIALAIENGINTVDPLYIRAAKTMGTRSGTLWTRVILPAAMPSLVVGMKQGWSFSWRSLMAGEMMFSSVGLGQILMMGRDLADIDRVMAIMIVIILIGTLMDRLVFGTWEKSIRKARGLDRDDPR